MIAQSYEECSHAMGIESLSNTHTMRYAYVVLFYSVIIDYILVFPYTVRDKA